MTVFVDDMAKQFRDWRINRELLEEMGYQELGPWGTRTGKIEVTELLASVESDEPGHRVIAARGLYIAIRKLSPEFTNVVLGCVRLAWDCERDVNTIATSALKQWRNYPEIFYPVLKIEGGRKHLYRIRKLSVVNTALARPINELEEKWVKLRQDGRNWLKKEKLR